jgi:phospho-N-acetylmuramoyl-pentapeptide-transferase
MPGSGVFQYISFRAAMAVIFSLLFSLILGKRIIRILLRKQVGETIRDLGLDGQKEKQGTPTMGGLIILSAILIPTLLFAKLHNVYVILMIAVTVWLGFIGFLDDYIKVFKKDKKGLAGKFKIIGQIIIGLVVGMTLYLNSNVVVREKLAKSDIRISSTTNVVDAMNNANGLYSKDLIKSTKTTIPFLKNNEFDYAYLLAWIGDGYKKWAWIVFIPIVILIVSSVSNGANITDGIDGLATGVSAIIGIVLVILAYVSGNTVFANYLNIIYIPNLGEVVVFMAAFVGACVGFLWYNSYPAQVFMGDTGSLALGGIIAVCAIAVRKELLIPILCGIFFVESLSVILQVAYFKYTRKRLGEGKRIFKMSPLHHHYQVLGYHEAKIVNRFWIVGIFLAVLTIVTLKLR